MMTRQFWRLMRKAKKRRTRTRRMRMRMETTKMMV